MCCKTRSESRVTRRETTDCHAKKTSENKHTQKTHVRNTNTHTYIDNLNFIKINDKNTAINKKLKGKLHF